MDKLVYKDKEYDLSQWITILQYCKVHSISNTQTVSNWIKRGVIPPDKVLQIPELNDLKLICNQKY